MIIMFGDYLIFQTLETDFNILLPEGTVGSQFRLHSISLSFLSLFWGGGETVACSAPA
jgi:hypothetical protein